MPITVKQYYCPVCGNQEKHSTNHYGEIYTRCKNCGNTPLYCAEDITERTPESHARLIFYSFNLYPDPENAGQREQYNDLCNMLKNKGYEKFDMIAEYKEIMALSQHDQEIVNIYNRNQFKSQYVTNIGRLHNWFEAIYPNNKIKKGYYLEFQD